MSFKKNQKKRVIGYARVSTQHQDITRMVKALKRIRCDVIFSDMASGTSMTGRPQLALDALDAGDELVIAKWDCATRSMSDDLQIIKAALDAEATIKVLDRRASRLALAKARLRTRQIDKAA